MLWENVKIIYKKNQSLKYFDNKEYKSGKQSLNCNLFIES